MDAHLEYANISEAAREGRINVLAKCTRKEINKLDTDGMTAVHWAALYGKTDALKLLISRGGLPDKPSTIGSTAVHYAAGGGSIQCLLFLTNYGCNVYAINDRGATAIQDAVSNGKLECVRHLEALVTHQVSQNKAKVSKMQRKSREEAEKRIRDRAKQLEKIDKGVEKKMKERERIVAEGRHIPSDYIPENYDLPKLNPHLPLPQTTRFNPSYTEGGGHTGESMELMANMEIETPTDSSSEINYNFGDVENNPGPSGMCGSSIVNSDYSTRLSNRTPSRNSNPIPTFTSLNSNNNNFVTSAPYTNTNLKTLQEAKQQSENPPKTMSASYDEILAMRTAPKHQLPKRAQSTSNLSAIKEQNAAPNAILQPMPPRPPPVTGLPFRGPMSDISMGPLYTLLHSLQLDEYRELFRYEKIDLSASFLCNEDDLREIGLPVGPRKKFFEAICKRNDVLKMGAELVDSAV